MITPVVVLPSLPKKKSRNTNVLLFVGTVLTLLSLVVGPCHAANTTSNEAESMEKGMDFLFEMTKGFLNVIQPNRIYEKYDLGKLKSYGDLEKAVYNWQELVMYLIGFAVCVAIGIVFIVIMPIIGCCMCCCRSCCNNCGGKRRKHDPKNAKYKRGCYATFLTIFNTFILFAVVCTFVTNELYKKRFIENPEIFNAAKKGTKNLLAYVDDSFDDLKRVARKQMTFLESDLLKQIQNAGNKSVTTLAKNIKLTSVINEVETLGNGVIELKNSITQLRQSLDNLNGTGTKLQNELDTVKSNVITKLSQCSKSECKQIAEFLNATAVEPEFSLLDKQSELLKNLTLLLDIPDFAKQAEQKLESVSKNVTDVFNKQNTTIVESFDKISNDLDSSINNVSDIKNLLPTKDIDKILNDALDTYNSHKTFSSIPWYVGLGVASILLLIVVCNYLGILFGLCGERPGDNAPCCNRGVAANFLLAGVGFYFLFCWILVLLVLIEFVFGGLLYTEMCRYLNKDDPSKLQPILIQFNFTYPMFGEDIPLVVNDVVDKCYRNYSLLNSISFPKTVLKEKLPTDILIRKIEEVPLADISIFNVELLNPELERKLKEFEDLKTNSINLNQYETELNELNKSIVTKDLNLIASNLTTLSEVVNISFSSDALKLKNIHETTYMDMQKEMTNLSKILVDVKKNINLDKKVSSLIVAIKDVQNSVKRNGNEYIKEIVADEKKELINITLKNVDQLINNIVNNVAPCRPLYNIIFSFTDIVCITLLNPMNGFWFSAGWAIFFFLPTIIFATKLAGLYRCYYKRDPNHENADSYVAAEADHIPLARVNQGKSVPQGMPNSAYDEIPSNKYHPPANPYHYGGQGGGGGHHYSSYPVYPPPSYHDTRMNQGRY